MGVSLKDIKYWEADCDCCENSIRAGDFHDPTIKKWSYLKWLLQALKDKKWYLGKFQKGIFSTDFFVICPDCFEKIKNGDFLEKEISKNGSP